MSDNGNDEWKNELYTAVVKDDIDSLLDCLKKPEVKRELPNIHDWGEKSALHQATLDSNLHFVKVLIRKGADINSYCLVGKNIEP